MKKLALVAFILSAQMLLPQVVFAGGTFSQSFKLVVFIPYMVGLNTPAETTEPTSLSTDPTMMGQIISNSKTDFTMIEGMRDNQHVIYRTLVLR